MTVPEVMNPSTTVGAATDPLQTMRNKNLQMIVERALDQLRQLTLQRQEIARKIIVIKRTINGLALLYDGELQRGPEDGARPERRRGITNACRVILNRADTPLSAHEVSAILQREFPDLVREPGNHYASLVTILNRLVKYGEADTFLRNGSRLWQRRQSADRRSVGLSDA